MKPVLSAWPPKKRTVAFVPFALGIFALSFLVVALATQSIFLALLLPPILGIAGAYALVGWPTIQMKDGKPLIEPRVKPYLFFVLAPLFALVLYPILGVALTQVGLPLKWLAIVSIVLSIAIAITAAYLLVGIPNLVATARRQYQEIPPERRPFLFFPIFVVLFLVLFLVLGVATTLGIGRFAPGSTGAILNVQVLVLLPVSLLLAGLLAWLLVGIPKEITAPAHHLPKVTGKHRPRAFLLTFVLGGIPLTVVAGALLTFYSALPATIVLALALLLGYLSALGIALLAWGTPSRWRAYDDYAPAIPPRAHKPLKIALSLFAGLAVIVAFGLAEVDLFWGVLVGAFVAGLVALVATGTHQRILARRHKDTFVPDVPDAMKPLILFPTWILIAFVLFAVLTYLLPGLVAVNTLVAVVVGLVVSFLVLEQPLLKDIREERRRERQKRKEWEARRKERLEEAEKGSPPPEA